MIWNSGGWHGQKWICQSGNKVNGIKYSYKFDDKICSHHINIKISYSDASEGIDGNKNNEPRRCIICNHYYFLK